jgi:transcriptional regulator with GAF, ATPase, and Fis domain
MAVDPRAKALSALARFQVADGTVGDTLNRIAEITLEAMPSASIVGMTMLGDDEQPTTAIYTNPESPEIDAAQYREGKGPCLDAWRTKRVFRVDRVEECADEYPAFAAACKEHGVLSTLSLPMISGDVAVGAMNLYADVPEGFSEDDEAMGVDLAGAAGSVLANVSAYWTAFDLSQQLNEAMKTRAVIEQAKGMIMARSPGMTADDAFDLLRTASQRENVKLRLIAQRIVDRRPPPSAESGRTP